MWPSALLFSQGPQKPFYGLLRSTPVSPQGWTLEGRIGHSSALNQAPY